MDKDLHLQLRDWSGVFPIDLNSVKKFCELYLQNMKKIGSWFVAGK